VFDSRGAHQNKAKRLTFLRKPFCISTDACLGQVKRIGHSFYSLLPTRQSSIIIPADDGVATAKWDGNECS
jgi:hypothetical protein